MDISYFDVIMTAFVVFSQPKSTIVLTHCKITGTPGRAENFRKKIHPLLCHRYSSRPNNQQPFYPKNSDPLLRSVNRPVGPWLPTRGFGRPEYCGIGRGGLFSEIVCPSWSPCGKMYKMCSSKIAGSCQ